LQFIFITSSSAEHIEIEFYCLSVCLFVLPLDISKIDATRITKLDVDMVHHES